MTELHTTCPSGWKMTGYSKRTCGRNHTGIRTCSSATFPVTGGEYSRVCGRIRAYQWGAINAFLNYDAGWLTTIEHDYAGCVSVTHGTPQNHIWTFVAGLSESDPTSNGVCPCDATRTIRIPPFVENVTTSVSRESMNYGAGINMSNFTPVIHYGWKGLSPQQHMLLTT